MSKKFAKRVSKSQRSQIDLSSQIDSSRLSRHDEMLLRGAELQKVALKDITVRAQVRTKFNDASLKELAENIKINGLIQPLVVHREKNKFVLICGERRFRAMSLLSEMKEAPCFILENKNPQELMAIQFSENSSREDLHYIDQADSIFNYKQTTGFSERKIQSALGISKSEVHRSLLISALPESLKKAAKNFNTEKYVLLEWGALEENALKKKIQKAIIKGEIVKRAQLKRMLKTDGQDFRPARKKPSLPPGMTANAFVKALSQQSKQKDLDAQTRKALRELLKETQQVMDL